jgi:hypothetical protein
MKSGTRELGRVERAWVGVPLFPFFRFIGDRLA